MFPLIDNHENYYCTINLIFYIIALYEDLPLSVSKLESVVSVLIFHKVGSVFNLYLRNYISVTFSLGFIPLLYYHYRYQLQQNDDLHARGAGNGGETHQYRCEGLLRQVWFTTNTNGSFHWFFLHFAVEGQVIQRCWQRRRWRASRQCSDPSSRVSGVQPSTLVWDIFILMFNFSIQSSWEISFYQTLQHTYSTSVPAPKLFSKSQVLRIRDTRR